MFEIEIETRLSHHASDWKRGGFKDGLVTQKVSFRAHKAWIKLDESLLTSKIYVKHLIITSLPQEGHITS